MSELEQLRQQTIDSIACTQDMQAEQIRRLLARIEALESRANDLDDQLAELEERRR